MMKNKMYFLNAALTVVIFLAALAMVLVRTFMPQIILPEPDIPNLTIVSLLALIIDHYAAPGAKRCYICIPVFSALSFGLLGWAAGLVSPLDALLLGISGGVLFTAITWVFTSMVDRISSGPAAKAAPVVSAAGLYLAIQCLMGMIL